MISMLSTNGETAYGIKEFLADTYNDIQTLSLKTAAAGSKAFCLETMTIYILNSVKEWVELPQQTGGGGGSVDVDLSDYATIEYVDSQIQLLLNNPDIDINSIADLLQELNKLSINGGEAFTKLLARIEAIDGDIVDIVNSMQDMAQVDQQQNETLERHDSYLQQIVLGEASYRAQELAPVADEETNYYVRYQNSELDLQRKTDTSITTIGLEENDIVFKKFTGDEMLEAPIQYNHIVENQFIDIGTNKPLCLLGMDDHACAKDDTLRFYLNKANTGHAFFSHSFEIEWKEGYDDGSCIPCVKIGDYYYEVTYARRFPQELKLLGYFSADEVWHSGRRDVDIEYNELIEIVFDLPFAPKEGEYYRAVKYIANYKERVFLYHSYSEHNGVKNGPYGAIITNGEFEMDADLNDTSTAKNKYYIDGYRLISKYKKKQMVSLNELASGTGILTSGLTPTATNPNFSWGTDDETVYDDATRLGTFTYLVSNRDFNVSTKVHPIGNYGVTKIEGIPVKLDDGSKISFIDASFRGFELSLHSEFYPDENALGKMYIQFITGATATEPERVRHFYRTLVPGWIKANGENTGLRRTWSPLTEIVTGYMLQELKQDYENKISTLEYRYNELNDKIGELQQMIADLEALIKENPDEPQTPETPYVTAPEQFVLTKYQASSNDWGGMIQGTYYPEDAALSFDVIITDQSIGDGGDYYSVTDSFAQSGHYEVTVHNHPNAAGSPFPSALKITATYNNTSVIKIVPIITQ